MYLYDFCCIYLALKVIIINIIKRSHLICWEGQEIVKPEASQQPESTFRRIVKEYIGKLLEADRLYWMQRNTRWVKLGNENTSLFQAMVTYSYSRKYISNLTLDDGSMYYLGIFYFWNKLFWTLLTIKVKWIGLGSKVMWQHIMIS